MKKFLCIMVLILLTSALAEATEFYVSEGGTLVDQGGVTVTVNPGYEIMLVNDGEVAMTLTGVIENNTDAPVELWLDNPTINRFQIDADVRLATGDMHVNPGNKAKCTIWFILSDADVSSVEEIETFETGFKVYDSANYEWLFSTDVVSLKGDGDVWH